MALTRCRWLSRPSAIKSAGHKVHQLAMAQEMGFRVPPTLVTQDPAEIRSFRQVVGRPLAAKLVAKGPPRAPQLEDQYVVFTQVLDDAVLKNDQALSACVAMYQPYIEKAFELRVTIVGRELFCCRIDSQASARTQTDWRNYDLANTPHTPFALDQSTSQLLLDLVNRLGLNFGAADLIVTPDGDTYFLELNPNGQWGWIEELTGLPIAKAHAEWLSGH